MSLLRARKKGFIALFILIISLFINSILSARPMPSYTPQYSVFSRDGSQLIYVNNNHREIIKQHARTGKIIKRIPFKLATNSALLAPTPDGFKLLAVHNRGIDVIHNGTGKVLRTLPHPSRRYDWKGQPIKQNSDGSLLAIPSLRSASPKIYLIHTGSGKIIRTIALSKQGKAWNPTSYIGSFGFSNNKRLLAYTLYSSGKPTLNLYDISRQKALMSIDMPSTGYTDATSEMIYFNRNNTKLIISGINQKTLKLVDITKKTVTQLSYPYASFANFSIDNKSLLLIQPYKNLLTFRDLNTGKQQLHKLPAIKKGYISSVIQSSNKAWLAMPINSNSAKNNGRFLLLNAHSGKVIH